MMPVQLPSMTNRDDIKTIPKPNPSETQNPLHLKEVQQAMNDNGSTWNKFSNTEWSSPDLLNRISDNPIIMAGMANPKFTAALEALKSNPKEAMEKFKDHKDVTEFLKEFCSVLGHHFTKLGEEQDANEKDLKEKDVGPMAFDAIQKEKERTAKGEKPLNEEMSKQEREQLNAIMKDEDLTTMLMDVDMQRVIQECSNIPGKMQMYMRQEDYGKKLRKLIQAGLLRVA